jgi:hypothetical protein
MVAVRLSSFEASAISGSQDLLATLGDENYLPLKDVNELILGCMPVALS